MGRGLWLSVRVLVRIRLAGGAVVFPEEADPAGGRWAVLKWKSERIETCGDLARMRMLAKRTARGQVLEGVRDFLRAKVTIG